MRAAVTVGVFLALAAGSAWGQYYYTNVNDPPQGEESHQDILTSIYGGTWSVDPLDPDGLDFINTADGITAKRVYDFDDEEEEYVHVLFGDETDIDQIWTDGIVTVTAEVKWAELNQSFGWNGGGQGTNYIPLLTDQQIGQSVQIEMTGEFLWGIRPTGEHPWADNTWWSRQSLNEGPFPYADGLDHMVTYFVEGLQDVDETVWLVFWEDYPCGGDEDFNDFVIEVRAIPEPSTALLLGAGLLAFGLHRRRA